MAERAIGEYLAMASIDGGGSQNAGDPAADAARVIEQEALSIFQAVDARVSEIDAHARRRADAIRSSVQQATAPALARLTVMSTELDALASELDSMEKDQPARLADGS